MRIVIASRNPVKRRAVEGGFRQMFPRAELQVEALEVASGVADQPHGDAETVRGAENRADGAAVLRPDADYWVGLEGGITDNSDNGDGSDGGLDAFAWAVVRGRGGGRGRSRTASFSLPPAVAALVRAGTELGEADDIVFGETGSKRRGGAVGLLTGGVIDRAALYQPAVALALIPFLRPDLYPTG